MKTQSLFRKGFWPALVCFLTLFQLSCGGSSNTNGGSSPPSTTTSSPVVPAAPPGPTGATGSSAAPRTWIAVTEVVIFCDAPSCSGSNGFTVQNDGTYRIGRLDSNDSRNHRQITSFELANFSAAADPVAAQSGLGLSCVDNPPSVGMPTYTLEMQYSDETSQQIISVNTQNSCYYGDAQLDGGLHQQMRQLELKYDPRGGPTGAGPSGATGTSGPL